jgi:hypothetical protein
MPAKHPIYLEVGPKRVFAGAIDWPGWSRSGRDEGAALEVLIAYGTRYKRAMARAASGFTPPKELTDLEVIERREGNASTDFGVPAIAPSADNDPVDAAEGRRLAAFMRASWKSLDRAADAAAGLSLRKGPRGGGRDLGQIVRHVLEAETGYLPRIGGRYRAPRGSDIVDDRDGVRTLVLETMTARARGEPMPPSRGSTWSLRYFVRRAAWHVLDHAWEIEDRAETPS